MYVFVCIYICVYIWTTEKISLTKGEEAYVVEGKIFDDQITIRARVTSMNDPKLNRRKKEYENNSRLEQKQYLMIFYSYYVTMSCFMGCRMQNKK